MLPTLILEVARMRGLELIAITDHNSCENAGAVMEASAGSSVKVLPGLEAQTAEGIHCLCLFDRLESAMELQEIVYSRLPRLPGGEKFYREQLVVDSGDEFVRFCERLISMPADIELGELWDTVTELGGMAVPSHIDKSDTGLCGVLGILPEVPRFDAVELSANIEPVEARRRFRLPDNMALFQSSDAHFLSAIGQRDTVCWLEHRTVEELLLACRGVDGRRVCDA